MTRKPLQLIRKAAKLESAMSADARGVHAKELSPGGSKRSESSSVSAVETGSTLRIKLSVLHPSCF